MTFPETQTRDSRPEASSAPTPAEHRCGQQTLHEARVRAEATMTPGHSSGHPWLRPALGGRAGPLCPPWMQRAGRAFWNRAHALGRSGVHVLGLLWFSFLSQGLFLAFPTHSQR